MIPKAFRILVDGMVCATCYGDNAQSEIMHYAVQYASEGKVVIQEKRGARWKKAGIELETATHDQG